MVQKDQIFHQVQQIICTILKNNNLEIDESTTSKEVEGWDSLTHMLIVSEIENQFKIKIGFRELMKVSNVGDLIRIIEKKVN